MNILGLTTFIQNTAACVLVDGKLTAFVEEERFLRIKSANGYFPGNSIGYCLRESKLTLKDIDQIAVGWDSNKYKVKMPVHFFKSWLKYGVGPGKPQIGRVVSELLFHQPDRITNEIKLGLSRFGHKDLIPDISFFSHHLSHAASTYFASGFEEAAILIVDGSGEEHATSIYEGKTDEIVSKEHINTPDSLGWFYAAMTAYLGFKPYEQDGFLMGLAPYGKTDKKIKRKLQRVLRVGEEGYAVDPKFTLLGNHSYNEHFSDELVELLGQARLRNEPITQKHKNVAFAAQSLLEDAALVLVQKATNNGVIRNLCLAGGVALNCKMNGVILRSGLIDKLFVQPVSHDAGSALGAAMLAADAVGDDPRFKMNHTYYGPQYSNKEIKSVLEKAGVKYSKVTKIEKKAAKAIAKGKIVGWFQGRMEVGPRALGSRSILANPTVKGMNDHVNNKVKNRDSWRPFCPSVSADSASKYYRAGTESTFMIVAYPILEDKRDKIPAVVHTDGSSRPQTVQKGTNPKYYKLIKELGELTGVEALLNTSLNVKGEPIACTPADAIRTFYSSSIDYLAMGDYWVKK